jgi:hypothetical protein
LFPQLEGFGKGFLEEEPGRLERLERPGARGWGAWGAAAWAPERRAGVRGRPSAGPLQGAGRRDRRSELGSVCSH